VLVYVASGDAAFRIKINYLSAIAQLQRDLSQWLARWRTYTAIVCGLQRYDVVKNPKKILSFTLCSLCRHENRGKNKKDQDKTKFSNTSYNRERERGKIVDNSYHLKTTFVKKVVL
jgi:hypothetical protein